MISDRHPPPPAATALPGRAGFTLLELMIVTVIIGILAMIGASVFGNVRERAMLAVVQSDLRHAMSMVDQYRMFNDGTLPSDLSQLATIGFRTSRDVVFCDFEARNSPAPHVLMTASHRRGDRAMTTQHPIWGGRMQEEEEGCDDGAAVAPGPGGGPPGGTPPGQGGTPPGQGGTPPGQGGTPPGQGGTPPGQGGTPPGQGGGG